MIAFILSRVGKIVSLALAVLAGVFAMVKLGEDRQRKDQRIKQLEKDKKVRDKIDDVQINTALDAAIDRLRRNGRIK